MLITDGFNHGCVHRIKQLLILTCSDNSQSYFIMLQVRYIVIFNITLENGRNAVYALSNPVDTKWWDGWSQVRLLERKKPYFQLWRSFNPSEPCSLSLWGKYGRFV